MNIDLWSGIAQSLLTAGSLALVLKFIGPKLIDHLLQARQEQLRQELQVRRESEIEQLRASLRAVAFERETRFAQLHARQAEVLDELHERLVDVHENVAAFLYPGGARGVEVDELRRKLARAAANALREAHSFFSRKRIYIDTPLCDEIAHYLKTAFQAHVRLEWIEQDGLRDDPEGKIRAWEQNWKAIDSEGMELLRKIEARFREILGVQESASR